MTAVTPPPTSLEDPLPPGLIERLRVALDIALAERGLVRPPSLGEIAAVVGQVLDNRDAENARLRRKLDEAQQGREANFELLSRLRWEIAEVLDLFEEDGGAPSDERIVARIRELALDPPDGDYVSAKWHYATLAEVRQQHTTLVAEVEQIADYLDNRGGLAPISPKGAGRLRQAIAKTAPTQGQDRQANWEAAGSPPLTDLVGMAPEWAAELDTTNTEFETMAASGQPVVVTSGATSSFADPPAWVDDDSLDLEATLKIFNKLEPALTLVEPHQTTGQTHPPAVQSPNPTPDTDSEPETVSEPRRTAAFTALQTVGAVVDELYASRQRLLGAMRNIPTAHGDYDYDRGLAVAAEENAQLRAERDQARTERDTAIADARDARRAQVKAIDDFNTAARTIAALRTFRVEVATALDWSDGETDDHLLAELTTKITEGYAKAADRIAALRQANDEQAAEIKKLSEHIAGGCDRWEIAERYGELRAAVSAVAAEGAWDPVLNGGNGEEFELARFVIREIARALGIEEAA